jgi:hypothetical protein
MNSKFNNVRDRFHICCLHLISHFTFRFCLVLFLLKHVFLCCFCFPCTRRRRRERRLPQHVVASDGRRRGPRIPRGADPHLQHLPDVVGPAPGLADGAAAGADHLLPSHRPRLHGAAQLRTVHRLLRYVSTFFFSVPLQYPRWW